MKIAFISFEYPPVAAYGGIATYTRQAAHMLARHGHRVEVFTSSPWRSGWFDEEGVRVHRVREASHAAFPAAIARTFAERHEDVAFDVLESPEYGADASVALELVPDIPLVVKLHTPSFLLTLATYEGLGWTHRLRWRLLAARVREYLEQRAAGGRPKWRYTHKYALDAERILARDADEIASPSRALAAIAVDAWHLDRCRVRHVPYPYVPSEALLALGPGGDHGAVTFVGRLEVRKGVLDLAAAIPQVLERRPGTVFRLLGPDDESPRAGMGMREYLARQLEPWGSAVQLLAPIPNHELPAVLGITDVVVLPSVWENFANACLEAMAAARAVVASEAGGMAEMLGREGAGRLVPPCRPDQLAKVIIELLDAPEMRREMGARARCAVLTTYSPARICGLQEQSYRRAIERRRAVGTRAR